MTTRVEIVNDFLAINVKPGSTIQDVVEASGSALPFGCREDELLAMEDYWDEVKEELEFMRKHREKYYSK